jgi:hypothetical protein
MSSVGLITPPAEVKDIPDATAYAFSLLQRFMADIISSPQEYTEETIYLCREMQAMESSQAVERTYRDEGVQAKSLWLGRLITAYFEHNTKPMYVETSRQSQ